MKKLIYLAFWATLLFGTPLFAFEDDAYKYVQVKTTATIATSASKIHTVSITSAVAPFTIYDSTHVAGTSAPIAIFSSTATGTFTLDLQTQNGIQLNGQANGSQVTVTYRP